MPRAEEEAWAITEAAASPDGEIDADLYMAEYKRGLAERHERLRRDARAVFRAMDGWSGVKSEEGWEAQVRQAVEDAGSGKFLIDRLGAERHLDPTLMAVLLVMRRRLIDEHGATGAAELMLVDCAVLSYYHTIRINGWIGNVAQSLEAEFFATEGLRIRPEDRHRSKADRLPPLRVGEIVQRLTEQLMPLLDRSNRMMIRNLKALQARRQGPPPSVSIGMAGQVNVATTQANTVSGVGASSGDAAPDVPAGGGRRSPAGG